jgi:hypothetical protein
VSGCAQNLEMSHDLRVNHLRSVIAVRPEWNILESFKRKLPEVARRNEYFLDISKRNELAITRIECARKVLGISI